MYTWDKLLINATTLDKNGNCLPNQALAIHNGLFAWCGGMDTLPETYQQDALAITDCQGDIVTPGLIDCHTHLVYAGNRVESFKHRLAGNRSMPLTDSNLGILSTVKKTRAASEEELLQQAMPRMLALRANGVSTVEIKSGYGLDLVNELKMLKVAKRLGVQSGIRVITTFLGAHAVPIEYQGHTQRYVDYLCESMLPAVAETGLADAIDVFCENIAFSLPQTRQIFSKAKLLALPIKCHAEQLSSFGACELAAEFGALSCDHLEYLDDKGANAMAKAQTIAVLLPGAYYFLQEQRKPPVVLLRERSIGIAVATDCNPGTSPTTSLLLMINMACHWFGLTVPEALSGDVSSSASFRYSYQDRFTDGRLIGGFGPLVCEG